MARAAIGPVPSPFDCYLVNRSLKTLHIRMRTHMENGLAVARFLETHPCVERVIHPGTRYPIIHDAGQQKSRNATLVLLFQDSLLILNMNWPRDNATVTAACCPSTSKAASMTLRHSSRT